MTTNNNNDKNAIINIYSINCENCHKTIEIPIKKSDKNSTTGGIFRIVAIHQCEEETLAFLLFFDENLALRQKVITPVTVTDINESDYVDDIQKEMFRLFSGFRFLYKKLKEEIAKVLFGLITGQQIVITGEQNEVEAVIESLLYFAEHRFPFVYSWTDEILPSADIIGTKSSNVDYYLNALIVDLENNVVINGFSNKFCLELACKINHLSDISTYQQEIRHELNQLRSISHDLIDIKNLNEIDSYLATLGIDLLNEDFIDIVILLTAKINPIVAQYYRINYQSEMSLNLQEIKPMRLWVFNDSLEIIAEPKISFDHLCNYKEVNIISKIMNLLIKNEVVLDLYEFFTPINQFIFFPHSINKVIYCFPRFDDDASIIENTLKFQTDFIDLIKMSSINNQVLSNILIKNWTDKLFSKPIPSTYSNLMNIRKKLPKLIEQSYLESIYLTTSISDKTLRQFITFLLEQLTESIGSEPKLLHKMKLYTITGVIIPDSNILKEEPAIEIQYNIYLYSQQQENNSSIGIVLDIFVKPQNLDFSSIVKVQMDDVYDTLIRILKFSIKKFTQKIDS